MFPHRLAPALRVVCVDTGPDGYHGAVVVGGSLPRHLYV